jgi:hypothetical protein
MFGAVSLLRFKSSGNHLIPEQPLALIQVSV